jgi:hypothetical protein
VGVACWKGATRACCTGVCGTDAGNGGGDHVVAPGDHHCCHFDQGHERGCWYNLVLGSYWGGCNMMGVVKHTGVAMHCLHSVTLGVLGAPTFLIVFGVSQLPPPDYWMTEGVHFVAHLPSLGVR